MHILLAMVMSLDGKTTRWHDPHIYTWTSKEDQQQFFNLIENYSVILMGRKTYETAKSMMKHTPDKKRIILTSDPKRYEAESIPGQLEFTDAKPKEIILELEKRGHTHVLLVGGEATNAIFLKEKLVQEIVVTIEPKLFGNGNMLLSPINLNLSLQLISLEQLNNQGTLLLRYKILS